MNYKGILNVFTPQAGVHFAFSNKLYRYDIGNSIITPTIPPATLNIHFHCTNAMNGYYNYNKDLPTEQTWGVKDKEPCGS